MVRRTRGTGETAASIAAESEGVKVTKDDLGAGGNRSGFAHDHLLAFCERVERLSEEIKTLSEDRTEVYAEAKAMGFDTKTLRKAIARRAMDPNDRKEGDAMLLLYEEGLEEADRRAFQKSKDEGGE